MQHWLFKTEPAEYSIDDLAAEPGGYTVWEGIRNYQARNILRDEIARGDRVLVYHSSCRAAGVVGTATIVRAAYPDPQQFNPRSLYFDAKSSESAPRWFAVDLAFESAFSEPVLLAELKQAAALRDMVLLRQGRLSVQPVRKSEFTCILKLAGARR